MANAEFVHYPNEKWFKPGKKDALPKEILDPYCLSIYNPDGELKGSHLIDTNSGNVARGICSLPFVRQSDQQVVYFPSNLVENLFVSNGMSAGNTLAEAHVLAKYPSILAGIEGLEAQGFPVLVKDASLGGKYPVMCVTLMLSLIHI